MSLLGLPAALGAYRASVWQHIGRLRPGETNGHFISRSMDQKLRQALGDILDTLTEHEREILEERFGPDGQHINTRDEVAQKLNTTRMDVRKVEAKTLRKFLHPKRMSKLRKVIKCQPSSRELYCMPMSLQDVIKRNLGES